MNEERYLSLGGIQQWISIRGISEQKPILIFLHGGPGISLNALFEYYNSELENNFLVVNWDQRGAGKSFSKFIPPESMKVDTFVSDLKELVEYLKKRFGKEKVCILGESWGSLLGIKYAQKYPEDVFAFIGTGQVSNMKESERLGYEFVLSEAKKTGNKKALRQLKKVSEYPGETIKDVKITRKWWSKFALKLYEKPSQLFLLRNMFRSKQFSVFDFIRLFRGHKMSLKLLWNEIYETNLFEEVSELNVPVYFLLGRHDHQVSSALAEEYFKILKAPKKQIVWFENSGHNPQFEEADLFNKAIISLLGKS